jgi:hypothetical protein
MEGMFLTQQHTGRIRRLLLDKYDGLATNELALKLQTCDLKLSTLTALMPASAIANPK